LAELYENPINGDFDFEHLKRIHHHLFQDLYDWAGQVRTVDIMRYPTYFCPTENIKPYSDAIFSNLKKDNYFKGLDPDTFAKKDS
jgi:cell filamentation protein